MSKSVAPGRPVLEYVPVRLLGSVMGLTGLSVAWHLAYALYGTPEWIALVIAAGPVVVFVLILAGYAVKLITAFGAVRGKFSHPIAATCPAQSSSACCCRSCRIVPSNEPQAEREKPPGAWPV